MNSPRERLLRTRGLAFFGAVAASLSHELNNVFATINELSGLLDDLALAAGQGRPLEPERIRSIIGRIAVQVERGQRQSKQLNRFAHSADSPLQEVDGGRVAEEMVALCERYARLRKVTVQHAPPEQPIALETDPFLLRHLLWRCLELLVSSSAPEGTVTIGMGAAGDAAWLEASASTPLADEDAEFATSMAVVAVLAEALGGRLDNPVASAERQRIRVCLPRRLDVDHKPPRDAPSGL